MMAVDTAAGALQSRVCVHGDKSIGIEQSNVQDCNAFLQTVKTHYSTGVRSNGREGRATQALTFSIGVLGMYVYLVWSLARIALRLDLAFAARSTHSARTGPRSPPSWHWLRPQPKNIGLTLRRRRPPNTAFIHMFCGQSVQLLCLVLFWQPATQSACHALKSCFRHPFCQIQLLACAPVDHWPAQGNSR